MWAPFLLKLGGFFFFLVIIFTQSLWSCTGAELLSLRRSPEFRASPGSVLLGLSRGPCRASRLRAALQLGAPVAFTDDDGRTALFGASCAAHVRLLLSFGASVAHRDTLGRTALFSVDAHSDAAYALTRALLAGGADADAVDSAGVSALVHSIEADKRVGAARALLEGGVAVGRRDARGRTALHAAAAPTHALAFPSAALALLCAHGADPQAVDDEGKTPLHLLMGSIYAGISMPYLLQCGDAAADPHARDRGGRNALHAACLAETPAVVAVEYLMQIAPELAAEMDALGNTPGHYCALTREFKHKQKILDLIRRKNL